MKISIVIPVYNEGVHLTACLNAIAAQTEAPHEVIIVNNNSTDSSVAVAEQFPFVRVINEHRQGVIYARGRGFNAATGDVIGRIDADTVIGPDWVYSLRQLFANSELDAVSGAVTYYDLPWRRALGALDLGFRQWIANGMGADVFLYGSNMALRRSSWLKVRRQVCLRAGLHEDFDLAIHLRDIGAHVAFDRRLTAGVSLRRFNVKFADYWRYVWLSPQTYRMHGKHSQKRLYPVVVLVVASYFVIQLLYRCYDPDSQSLSFTNLLNERSPLRVNPTTYVD